MLRTIGLLSCLTVLLSGPVAFGQGNKKLPAGQVDPTSIKSLDTKAQTLETEFLKGLTDLATSYEEAGDKDKAKAMLQAILKVRPDADLVKEKIKQIDESVFLDRQLVIDLDTARGWISTGIVVEKGKEVRMEAAGTYKLIVNDELGPEGYRSADGKGEDFVDGVPTGALVGVIVPVGGASPRPQRGKDGPQPFMVGSSHQLTPRESGLLVMRVNSPANAKCVGRLKLRISGNISQVGK